jgi:large subunit ribosomal protein L6
MITREIPIPEGVEARLEGRKITVKGPKGEVSRELFHRKVDIELKDDRFVVSTTGTHAGPHAMVGTFTAHITNMVKGSTEGFHYILKMVQTHFPMTVKVKGKQVFVENLLGERYPRRCNIIGATKVNVKKDEVHVEGIDKEHVGQTAANIERMSAWNNSRDKRVFQDGILIMKKG